MKVVLFGSFLNPLSAAAAHFFNERKMLKAIVLQRGLPVCFQGGVIYLFSLTVVALYRCFHVLLRYLKLKRSKTYLSLLEFIKDNPNISIVHVSPKEIAPEQLNLFKDIDDEEYIIVSCIFPFKIPVDIFSSKKLINIHPGILPDYRGPNPYFWTIVNKQGFSGITYHVLTSKFDKGPILLKDTFTINSNLSEYGLEKLTVERLRQSLPIFFEKLDCFWQKSSFQEKGAYYPNPSSNDRKRHLRYSVF